MTKRLLAVAALVLLTTGALAGVTGASSQGSKAFAVSQGKLGIRNGVIYGCVETHGSKQTLGDLKLANCHKGFKAIAWNIRGPKGPKGASGVGTPGPQGPQGPQGSQGSARLERRQGRQRRPWVSWTQRSERGRNAHHQRPRLRPLWEQPAGDSMGESQLHADASVHPAERWVDPGRSFLQRNVHDRRGRPTPNPPTCPGTPQTGGVTGTFTGYDVVVVTGGVFIRRRPVPIPVLRPRWSRPSSRLRVALLRPRRSTTGGSTSTAQLRTARGSIAAPAARRHAAGTSATSTAEVDRGGGLDPPPCSRFATTSRRWSGNAGSSRVAPLLPS